MKEIEGKILGFVHTEDKAICQVILDNKLEPYFQGHKFIAKVNSIGETTITSEIKSKLDLMKEKNLPELLNKHIFPE